MSVNPPRAFQLVFHWIMCALAIFGLIYVPTEYLRGQRGYLPFLEGQQQTTEQEEDAEEEAVSKPSRAQQLQGLKIHGRISHTTLRSLVK